ncbi:MAG: malate dehydrogenase [Candidatus Poribacteria bacterium]|nr:MAG: malate dehydrogenase [Candidatus Poribacteria bacterium]
MDETRVFDMKNKEVRTTLRGYALLRDPLLNKGTAFTHEERVKFQLEGFLPARVTTLEEQMARLSETLDRLENNLDKYEFLRALQDRNETLFYAFVMSRMEELVPIVYTPTVGEAVQKFSHIFRRPRGIYVDPTIVDRLPQILMNYPSIRNVRLIVATDSEGILGIGDQGAGGMGISIGKLALYVLGAGIHPSACLPIALDVGTNNPELLDDPFYLGYRRPRLRGKEYLEFMDRFVEGVRAVLPGVLLQWEDLSKQNAFTVLERYQDVVLSFNDDVQGTGAVALGGVLAALRITGKPLTEQRIAILGAGAGGIGIAHRLASAMAAAGLPLEEARRRIYPLDSRGLVLSDRPDLEEYKRSFAHSPSELEGWFLDDPNTVRLLDVVRNARPTVLIGVSGQPGQFTEAVVREMAQHTPQPIIFPLSNPTARAEARPADLIRWSEGRAIVATGSPFPPVEWNGRRYRIGQGNNVFVFPGIGLGAMMVRAKQVTDRMLTAAGVALAEKVTSRLLEERCVYPPMAELRQVTAHVAAAVAQAAIEDGVADPVDGDLEEMARSQMWEPRYDFKYVPVLKP